MYIDRSLLKMHSLSAVDIPAEEQKKKKKKRKRKKKFSRNHLPNSHLIDTN